MVEVEDLILPTDFLLLCPNDNNSLKTGQSVNFLLQFVIRTATTTAMAASITATTPTVATPQMNVVLVMDRT